MAVQQMQSDAQRAGQVKAQHQRVLQHSQQLGFFVSVRRPRPAQLLQVQQQKTQADQAGQSLASGRHCADAVGAAAAQLCAVAGPAVGHQLQGGQAEMHQSRGQQADLQHGQPGTAVQGTRVGLELCRCHKAGNQAAQMHHQEQHQQKSADGCTTSNRC